MSAVGLAGFVVIFVTCTLMNVWTVIPKKYERICASAFHLDHCAVNFTSGFTYGSAYLGIRKCINCPCIWHLPCAIDIDNRGHDYNQYHHSKVLFNDSVITSSLFNMYLPNRHAYSTWLWSLQNHSVPWIDHAQRSCLGPDSSDSKYM